MVVGGVEAKTQRGGSRQLDTTFCDFSSGQQVSVLLDLSTSALGVLKFKFF